MLRQNGLIDKQRERRNFSTEWRLNLLDMTDIDGSSDFLLFQGFHSIWSVVLAFIARGLFLFLGFNPITGEPYPDAKVGDHFLIVIKFIQILNLWIFVSSSVHLCCACWIIFECYLFAEIKGIACRLSLKLTSVIIIEICFALKNKNVSDSELECWRDTIWILIDWLFEYEPWKLKLHLNPF